MSDASNSRRLVGVQYLEAHGFSSSPRPRLASRTALETHMTRMVARSGVVVIVGLAASVLLIRLFVGVDFTDESYYAAFVKDWISVGSSASNLRGLHQTAFLPVYPFVWVFHWFNSDSDGLVLFMRLIYFTFVMLVAATSFLTFARQIGRTFAASIAVFIITFVPFALATPSYNTLGMFGLLEGLLLLLAADMRGATAHRVYRVLLFAAGASFALASFTYPTLVIGALLTLAVLGIGRLVTEIRLAVLGFLVIFGVLSLGLMQLIGVKSLIEVVQFNRDAFTTIAPLSDRLTNILLTPVLHPAIGLLLIGALLVGVLHGLGLTRSVTGMSILGLVGLGCLLLLLARAEPTLYLSTHDQVLLIATWGTGTIGAQALLTLRRSEVGATVWPNSAHSSAWLFPAIFGVSVVTGLLTSVSATNGLMNFVIGGFAAAVLALASGSATLRSGPSRISFVAVLVIAISVNVTVLLSNVYGEPRSGGLLVAQLLDEGKQVSTGPFAGLVTTPERAEFLRRAQAEVDAACPSEGLFHSIGMPAMYLLADAGVAGPIPWTYPVGVIEGWLDNLSVTGPDKPACVAVAPGYFSDPRPAVEQELLNHSTPVAVIPLPEGRQSLTLYRVVP